MESLPKPITLLKSCILNEQKIAQQLKGMLSGSIAAQDMLDPTKTNLKSLNKLLFRYMRIQSGYCATKYVMPWLSKKGFKANEEMYFLEQNENKDPLKALDAYIELFNVDQDFYPKALAYLLVINKQLSLADEELGDDHNGVLDRILKSLRFSSFTIDHSHKSQNMPEYKTGEDPAGLACLILHVLGLDAQYAEAENFRNASLLLNAYSLTQNSFTLHGITVQKLKSGKTKYSVSKEHGKLLEERVLPHAKNFKNLWALPK